MQRSTDNITSRKRNRPNRPSGFYEALGATQAPAGVTPAAADMPRIGAIFLAVLAAIAIFFAATYVTHRLADRSSASVTPAGSIPLNTTVDTSRAQQARTLAAPQDKAPAGQQTGVPALSGSDSSSGDGYMLQGSVGTAGVRH